MFIKLPKAHGQHMLRAISTVLVMLLPLKYKDQLKVPGVGKQVDGNNVADDEGIP